MTAVPLPLSLPPVPAAAIGLLKFGPASEEFTEVFAEAFVPDVPEDVPPAVVSTSGMKPIAGRAPGSRPQASATESEKALEPGQRRVEIVATIAVQVQQLPADTGSAVSPETADSIDAGRAGTDLRPLTESARELQMGAMNTPPVSPRAGKTRPAPPSAPWCAGQSRPTSGFDLCHSEITFRHAAAAATGRDRSPTEITPPRNIFNAEAGSTGVEGVDAGPVVLQLQEDMGAGTPESPLPSTGDAKEVEPHTTSAVPQEFQPERQESVGGVREISSSRRIAILSEVPQEMGAPLLSIERDAAGACPETGQAPVTERRRSAANKTKVGAPDIDAPEPAVGTAAVDARLASQSPIRQDAVRLVEAGEIETPVGQGQQAARSKGEMQASAHRRQAGPHEQQVQPEAAVEEISVRPRMGVVRPEAVMPRDTAKEDAAKPEGDSGMAALHELAGVPQISRAAFRPLPSETVVPLSSMDEDAPLAPEQAKATGPIGSPSTPELALGDRLARAAAGKVERPKFATALEPDLAFAGRLVHAADTAPAAATPPEPQAASPEPRLKKMDDMPRPSSVDPAPEGARPAATAREIRVQVDGVERVELRMVERGGEVHVAVRTPDSKLAGALREDLPALSARLEQAGLRAASWHTGQVAGERPASPSSGGSSGDRQDQAASDEGRRQHGRQEQKEQQNAPRKEQRKDLQWLFTSLR